MSSRYDLSTADRSSRASSSGNALDFAGGRQSDFWSDVPAGPVEERPVAAAPPAPDPVARVKRLLRGRTALAISLATAGALVGAAVGFMSEEPVYRAFGTIRVNSSVSLGTGLGNSEIDVATRYQDFMRTEAATIDNNISIAEAALKEESFAKLLKEKGEKISALALMEGSKATFEQGKEQFSLTFDHPDKAIADRGVFAMMWAYEQYFLANLDEMRAARQLQLDEELIAAENRVNTLQQRIDELLRDEQGVANLADYANMLIEGIRDLQEAGVDIREHLRLSNMKKAQADSMLPEALAVGDSTLAELLERRKELSASEEMLLIAGRGGENHPDLKLIRTQLDRITQRITDQSAAVRQVFFGTYNDPSDPRNEITVTQGYIDSLTEAEQRNADRIKEAKEELARISEKRDQFNRYQDSLGAARTVRDTAEHTSQSARMRDTFASKLGFIETVPSSENQVKVAEDKRKAMMLGGAVLGGGVPLSLVLLLGLLDNRFRYSDDAADLAKHLSTPHGPTKLLGILPNLPDRLSDPNQASIAAHCVHQIRTMLQIDHNNGQPTTLAITSATRGDGKTSLALALGLSYAASGCQTLLIDCDLQGGGLSERMGVGGDEGIINALAQQDLMEYVCETDVDDLALLPLGNAGANHAGAFSPNSVRTLVAQAKRHYDVVIFDCGPILGSIEATPIAAGSDGTIVTVARGQGRGQVEKAISQLNLVGAQVSGIVFNRAQTSDFEKSVSGMNFRNQPRLPAAHTPTPRPSKKSGLVLREDEPTKRGKKG